NRDTGPATSAAARRRLRKRIPTSLSPCGQHNGSQPRHAKSAALHTPEERPMAYSRRGRRADVRDRPGTMTVVKNASDFPRVLGRYELAAELGKGAMARVFLARDPRINREVAIKAFDLANECAPDELDGARARFLREAEAAGRLNHPNIVTIYDVGESDGIVYIAMELVAGRRLSDYASAESLLPPRRVLELLAAA